MGLWELHIKSNKNLEQGSAEWLDWRNKGVGSSDIPTILGLNPYKTLRQLFLEKCDYIKQEDLSGKAAVKRGVLLEPVARDLISKFHNVNYVPMTFEMDENDLFRYSSDGVFEDDIIEIKCMGIPNHEKVIFNKEILPYYYPQCQWGLMVSKKKRCHFVSYNEEHAKKMVIITVEPDNVLFDEMTKKASMFLEAIKLKDWNIISHFHK